jgi:hypothetical protein
MATNITKLKGKGAPPQLDASPDPIQTNVRSEEGAMRPLQFRVPEGVFEEFSETAGREFGFSHGAKKQLFLKMWDAYKERNA